MYLDGVATEDRKCDIEIRKRSEKKSSKVLYFVRNKRILDSDVISILSESSECETIIVHRKKILETSFYEQMLIIYNMDRTYVQ